MSISPLLEPLLSSYMDNFIRSAEFVREGRGRARTRFVGFVAIAGYVLVNGPAFWRSIAGNPELLNGGRLFVLLLPWVLSAFSALVAYDFVERVEEHENVLFIAKKSALETAILDLKAGKDDGAGVLKAFDDDHPAIVEPKRNADRSYRHLLWLDRVTTLLFSVSFVGSLLGGFFLLRP